MYSGIKSRIVYRVSCLTNFPISYVYDKGKHVAFLFSLYINDLIFFFLQMNDVRMIGVTDMSY